MEISNNNYIDTGEILKGIEERNRIALKYNQTGVLDRNDAISKIEELRFNDLDIAEATCFELSMGAVPFDMATDYQIVNELIMQKNILVEKLIKMNMEKYEH